MLEREEYVEQAYFFGTLAERLPQNLPMQDLLRQTGEELLASTKLPMAIDFMRTELEHAGVLATAMASLPHYFTPFQTYLMREAEKEGGRFDIRVGLKVLQAEAEFRANEASPQGMFLFHFEVLCRNRLRYDPGLTAMAEDPIYDGQWRSWILVVRRQIGLIDLADLLYVRSRYYQVQRSHRAGRELEPEAAVLFGEKEGKIAFSNRGKEPLYLFAALQRHLKYPLVPRPIIADKTPDLIPQLLRRVEQLETKVKLVEQEQRQGIDITEFYEGPKPDKRD
ncbi:MAG: hypothetical protein QF918_06055 [Pirellulaceae bacterium]|nr:hypothetical protein [Pirellulaceae bacterium]MDP6555459.1 hypothetical protein [Pirellulaceae bacterium]